jgi:hypothetical protein
LVSLTGRPLQKLQPGRGLSDGGSAEASTAAAVVLYGIGGSDGQHSASSSSSSHNRGLRTDFATADSSSNRGCARGGSSFDEARLGPQLQAARGGRRLSRDHSSDGRDPRCMSAPPARAHSARGSTNNSSAASSTGAFELRTGRTVGGPASTIGYTTVGSEEPDLRELLPKGLEGKAAAAVVLAVS